MLVRGRISSRCSSCILIVINIVDKEKNDGCLTHNFNGDVCKLRLKFVYCALNLMSYNSCVVGFFVKSGNVFLRFSWMQLRVF